MPPTLASLLCTGFILWLFYREARAHPKISMASWIPTLWVGIIASKPVAAWIYGKSTDLGLGNGAQEYTIDRNVMFLLIISGMIVLARRQVRWGVLLAENRWLVVFELFMFASVFWSDDSFVAFKRWFRVAGNSVMILCILTELNPVEAIRKVFIRCAYILIPLSLLVMKYYPEIGVFFNEWTGDIGYCGETTDKNALGRLAWVSVLFLLWSLDAPQIGTWFRKIRKGWPEAVVLGLCLGLLFKAGSATALACFIVSAAVYFGSRARWVRANPKLLALAASAFIITSLVFLAVPDLRQIVTGSLGRRVDLTDRTDVWDNALKLQTNSLIGVGFDSFWLTRQAREMGERLRVNEAHNGYLETYLDTGIIGVGLVLVILLCAGRNTIRHTSAGSPICSLYAALLLGGIIYNYTEAAINDSSLVGFIIWQFAVWYPLPSVAPKLRSEIELQSDK